MDGLSPKADRHHDDYDKPGDIRWLCRSCHVQHHAKEKGFEPGGASLHNCMSPHGPEAAVFEKASNADLQPQRYDNTLAFMFESRYAITPTRFAMTTEARQLDYVKCWDGLKKNFSTQ